MELVQTPLGPLNVFATMDTLETDAIVQVVIQTLRRRVGPVTQKFFSAIRASLWSKNKGLALPLDTPLSSEPNLLRLINHIVE